jgi:hypothetical protein
MTRALVVAGVLMLGWVGAADAQTLYRWTDAQGAVFITDSLQRVPPERRDTARAMKAEPVPVSSDSAKASARRIAELDRQAQRYERDAQEAARANAEDRVRAAQARWSGDVAECTAGVRRTDPGFRVHIPSPGRVKMFGTASARYEFGLCLDSRGHDTSRY